MIPNIKKITIQGLVFLVNLALIATGVFYIKNQQDEKIAADDLVSNAIADDQIDAIDEIDMINPVAEKAAQLQRIIENTTAQKRDSVANNTGQINTQKPITVTKTIPGATKTVTTTSPSSIATQSVSAAKPSPAKTTKKS